MAPKIISRKTTKISPWVEIVAREVDFGDGELQTYHAVGQSDYVAILALTTDRKIPLVRQYRPAVERFTWELPAGLVDAGEDAAESARRELLEETGWTAKAVHPLGITSPCTGRLSNRLHSFFVEAAERKKDFKPEAGVSVEPVSTKRLAEMISSGDFINQLHIGTILQAAMHSFIELEPDFRATPSTR